MLQVDVPGFGPITLEHLVSDFTGTLSVGGKLLPGVEVRLNQIAEFLQVQILTADTFGVAKEQLKEVKCSIQILSGASHDQQKEKYVIDLGAQKTVALGNGNNDRRMLKAAKVGIAVTEGEGCAVDAVMAADIQVNRAVDALDLLLHSKRLKATLRF
ncbi:MAG: HAD hydrolase family protein [Deltaproteobacteria bacterium]|nr:HAD hydrolase family protein [Deltaproteobacteria bacterium]